MNNPMLQEIFFAQEIKSIYFSSVSTLKNQQRQSFPEDKKIMNILFPRGASASIKWLQKRMQRILAEEKKSKSKI